jgi:hypothetical protein
MGIGEDEMRGMYGIINKGEDRYIQDFGKETFG